MAKNVTTGDYRRQRECYYGEDFIASNKKVENHIQKVYKSSKHTVCIFWLIILHFSFNSCGYTRPFAQRVPRGNGLGWV